MTRRWATIAGGLAAILAANLLLFGGARQSGSERERRLYESVAARATQPVRRLVSQKTADALADCLAGNPTGRLRLTPLSRGVRDASRNIRYDRVLLNEPVALLIGIVDRRGGGAGIVVLGRPGRTLEAREAATIAACR
ncbi:hypothetical protein M9980_03195 [Sphingomonas donggukensis]|uniref:DUF4359 domain-containing protein n=1 Tax=Sphingomonas donggukensis TaxID=2949093 RepID=A0ABY4TX58_9SPHN|nr:hypothetical protein [Sphingomonas donggukensis]URW76246.1 hypothetical protein M9980_03195 [Sphingomonas donggukensis]